MTTPSMHRQEYKDSFKYVDTLRPELYYLEVIYECEDDNDKIFNYFKTPGDGLDPNNTAYKSPILSDPSLYCLTDYEHMFEDINEYAGNFLEDDTQDMIKHDRKMIFAGFKNHISALRYTPDLLLNDYTLAIKMLPLYDGKAYIFLSDSLRKDERILRWIVDNKPELIKYVDTDIKNYELFVSLILGRSGLYLEFAPLEIQANKKFVTIAVQKNGNALEFASLECKNDKDIVMTAVKNKGSSLKFASSELQDDYTVVSTAVQKYGKALKHASINLKNTISIITLAILNNEKTLKYVSDDMKTHPEIIGLTNGTNKRKRES